MRRHIHLTINFLMIVQEDIRALVGTKRYQNSLFFCRHLSQDPLSLLFIGFDTLSCDPDGPASRAWDILNGPGWWYVSDMYERPGYSGVEGLNRKTRPSRRSGECDVQMNGQSYVGHCQWSKHCLVIMSDWWPRAS